MLFNLALLAVAALPSTTAQSAHQDQGNDGPQIEVWTDHDDVYQRGERARVHFRASESGYVTIFRIDTDGRVRVLYPIDPWDDNYARRDREYEVRTYGDKYAFSIDDYPGQGYVFAVISRDPFSYGALVRGDHWDYRMIAEGGRVTGDPYVALTDLVDRIVPPNYSEYGYDVQPYYVEQHYQYPRFLCYDCHSYASYTYWNPYSYSCFRFRIVIYDDFYYQPRRYYRGQPRVIYRTAPRLAPRYVFKDRGPSEAWVTNVRERPVDATTGRRVVDRGVTSRDLGSNGRVPTPINSTGRRPSTSSDNAGGNNGGGGYNGGRRTTEPDQGTSRQGGGAVDNRRPDVRSPNDRPGRQSDGAQPVDDQRGGRRPDAITPPAPQPEDRQQPTLERRDPRREPERDNSGDNGGQAGQDNSRRPIEVPNERPRVVRPTDREPQREPDRPKQQEPQRQPDRPQVDRQPQREPERPRVERQPENRPQPQAREPERRTEPRSEPKRVEKPQDPEQRRRSE